MSGYDVLFGDLALVNDWELASRSSDGSGDNGSKEGSTALPSKPKVIHTTTSRRQQKHKNHSQPQQYLQSSFSMPDDMMYRSKYSKSHVATSMLDFDDSLDLDDALKLRIQLDEQEAKIDFLRDKILDLEHAENELVKQEERIGEMIGEIINSKDNIIQNPSKTGLSKARALLLRICDLEERVLCREVEVGQLKNDITLFELGATGTSSPMEHDEDEFDEENEDLDFGDDAHSIGDPTVILMTMNIKTSDSTQEAIWESNNSQLKISIMS